MRRQLALTLCVASISCLAYGAESAENFHVYECQQDQTGRIWGLLNPDGAETFLAYWQDGQWKRCDYSPDPGSAKAARPDSLERTVHGEVVVRWYSGEPMKLFLSVHRGDEARIAAQVLAPKNYMHQVVVDASGTIWATRDRGLFCLPKSDQPAEFPAKPITYFSMLQYHESPIPAQVEQAHFTPPSLMVDPSGRAWAWGRQVPPYETSPGLKGIFLLQDGKLEPHANLEGIPDAAFSVFEHKLGDTYWIAVIGHGLYEFDMKSLRGIPVSEPEPDAFRNVFQVTAVHDDWYVLAAPKAVFNDEIEKPAVLWRLRGGAWQRVLTGLGQLPRCIAQSDEGLWVSAPNEGLWFVPQSGSEPVLVDWRRGLDARGIYNLFPLSGPTVFAIMSRAQWGGRNIMRELRWSDFKNPLRVATNVKEARAFTAPVLDKAGLLWSVRPEEPKSLGAWDGVSWTNYPLPPDVAPLAIRCLAPDNKGRIWLCQCKEYKGINYDPANGPVHIFDTASHQWTNHESFPNALVAERAKVGDFQLNEEYVFQPVFGPRQQIAFLENSEDSKIHYFDGSGWHVYERGIVKTTGRTRPRLEGVFFNDDNRLSVKGHTENNETGEYKDLVMTRNDDDTWASVDGPAPTPLPPPSRRLRERPDYPVQKDGEYINYTAAVDARDILWYWYMKDGQLIRGGLGAEVPQFAHDEAHPFRTVENIWRANIDLAGNVWFLANSAREMYVFTPREPAVDTQAAVAKENVDTVRITMAAPNSAEPRYVWRMDGGAWSMPQKDTEVRMASLSGGEHTFEAFAVDEYLTPDATSAIATFTIDIDTGQQIAGWIEQLSSPDYEVRANAVKALQQRPEASLKALREARPNVPEGVQWWIDVAIQQVEKKQKAPAP